MTINGLHLMLGFLAALAAIGWSVDHRRRVTAERQRDIAERIAGEKARRLFIALDERDAARRHADDAQWVLSAIVGPDEAEAEARRRHPSNQSNVRVLRSVT